MEYEVKTKEQIVKEQEERQKSVLWEPGVYDFKVIPETAFGNVNITTMDTHSKKSGAEMILLVLELMDKTGGKKVLIDYMVAAMPEKLFSASMALGLNYKSGKLFASDFLYKQGRVQISVAKGKPKPDGSGNYPDKNEVVTYIEGDFKQDSLDEQIIPF